MGRDLPRYYRDLVETDVTNIAPYRDAPTGGVAMYVVYTERAQAAQYNREGTREGIKLSGEGASPSGA